ncbi:hypothetical protein [Enterovibrio coralii]|uniref:Lipoprotein n=1 Tax=Enterovibrio coralii TaxID=294935 RepID=A0A135I5X1_9GAMM|nr:hypothetical protein [Enterovibrio coralii]KXF80843.1 hypothetical protein ATN88_16370 [Enterovibrio coralii]
MNATRSIFGALSVALMSACTIQTDPAKPLLIYTAKQAVKLSYCDDLANTAYQIAEEKRGGATKQSLFTAITNDSSAEIKAALVDDIYRSDLESSWAYATNVFSECATKVADIPSDNIEVASLCAQKSLVALGAGEMFQRNEAKVDAYTAFAPYKSVRPFVVVDKVYEERLNSQQASDWAWDYCMSTVSD